jgi:hypothetical protein
MVGERIATFRKFLPRAKEQKVTEMHIKILESDRDKLLNIAETVHNKAELRLVGPKDGPDAHGLQ